MKTNSMHENRELYKKLMDRVLLLNLLGSESSAIVGDLQKTELYRQTIKGKNRYVLHHFVVKLGEKIFQTEKRIVQTAPKAEWEFDERLCCIGEILSLRPIAEQCELTISLKPNQFILHVGELQVYGNYCPSHTAEAHRLIEVYRQALAD